MTTNIEMPADQLLAKLFEVVLDEARANKRFAEKLVGVLPENIVVRIDVSRRKSSPTSEVPASLTRIMNREGEDSLRAFLKARNKVGLRGLVERQQIPIELSVFDQDIKNVREAIVEGVKSKIADRLAAAS
jgi:hypothetical protein